MKESCRHARSRYSVHLDEEKKKKQLEAKKRKLEESVEELDRAISKRRELEGDVKYLIKQADEQAVKAAKKKDLTLLVASNALREKAKALERHDMAEIDDVIKKLRQKHALE